MPTPCREYWGDVPDRRDLRARLGEFGGSAFDEPANPLLVSLGGVGRDFVAQLFAYDEVQPDIESDADANEPPRTTLLQRVQADVITLSAPDPADGPAVPAPGDVSLQIHSCHSPLREVQVLHDRLLDLLEHTPGLQPRDIAVMMPDIARYAPCVDAVFGAIDAGDPRYIPWTVADRPASEAHAITALFDRLLDLPASRLELDDVLEVIAVPAVMRACALEGADLQRLHGWAVQAGIRWGEDEHDREAQGLPPFREFSWRFGRERLLLGYLLGDDDDDSLVEGIAPLADIEGQRAAALGQLLRVQRLLRRLRAAQRVPKTPRQWQRLLNRALGELLADDSGEADEQRALGQLRAALAALAENAHVGGFEQPLDWTSVRAFLREQLDDLAGAQRFLAGGVSVCGMVPLRNVPFRVICVLGMDAQSFPRRDPADALSRLHADVLAGRRRPGDRSLRDDDRYLFLQTLMAARDALYLSYTGIDLRDGSEREPSVVLSELLDIVATHYFADAKAARAALVTQHPMQPFARALFDGAHTRLFTYRREWQAAAAAPMTRAALPPFADMAWPTEPSLRVAFDDLQRFFRAPQREFLRRQVGAALEADALDTPDREPLVEDPRQRADVDRQLVRLLLRDDHAASDDTVHHAQLRAQGLLPPLALGEQAYAQAMDDVGPQAAAWRRWRAGQPLPPAMRFELSLPSGRVLEGVLPGLETGGYAGWVGRANSARRWFDWWLGALVARALHDGIRCVAFGRKADDLLLPLVPAMPAKAEVLRLLDVLLEIREQGLASPLPMPPRSAWTFMHSLANGKPEGYSLDKAAGTWDGAYQFSGESADPWIATALRGASPFDHADRQARFMALAQDIDGPLWTALTDGMPA
jgi:exodeoxyribonuclease V gamma subunit